MFLEMLAEIGVILLMFNAGLETELKELKKNIFASFVTAILGVVVPLLGGFLGYTLYFGVDVANYDEMLKIAATLSENIPFLRVDLYNVKGKIYFGEMTFFPNGGYGTFTPKKWNGIMGEMIELKQEC